MPIRRFDKLSLLGGWAPRTYGYVVNNHGDRTVSPLRIGLVPLQMADIYGGNKWG